MPLGIDFGEDFGGFGEPKWSHVGTQMEPKMDLMLRTPKIKKTLKNQWNCNDFGGSGGPSWEQKSIKKGGQHGKASWHRFLIDFGGFWEASWGRKSNKNRSKKASKNEPVLKHGFETYFYGF